jgi:NCS1 family nucleobase:cation symporter-1
MAHRGVARSSEGRGPACQLRSEGASLFWSVLAIVVGVLVGTLFMAFHSAQGPQLGLPQMIQSRRQFGVVAGYQISWAIYVSDYSRYMPPDVPVRKTFYWTY